MWHDEGRNDQAGEGSNRLLSRGVYVERFTVNGHRMIVAVDSDGEMLAIKTATTGELEGKVNLLWDMLDRMDPRPGDDDSPSLTPQHLRLLLYWLVVGLCS